MFAGKFACVTDEGIFITAVLTSNNKLEVNLT
jgi:hypothetical protein